VKQTVLLAIALSLGAMQAAQGEDRNSRRDLRHDSRTADQARAPAAAPSGQLVSPNDLSAKTSGKRGDADNRTRYFSPEERRKLRRDINDAGRDIYRREHRRR
jgi:hypothetical protein